MSLPVYVGSTTHYTVHYDSAMNLAPLANAFLTHVETDYVWCRYFWPGVPEPFAGGRVNVFITVTPGLQSATWPLPPPGLGGTEFDITIRVQQPEVDQVLTDVRALFAMELSEEFMLQQGTGWCGGSTTPGVTGKQEGTNGEALSQVFGIEAQRHIDNFTPFNFAVQDWLQSPDRPDAVNSTESPAGSNDYRVGCNVIFIYYLMHQLQFSFAEICAAPGTTLREVYNNLTGTTSDPFPAFRAAIDAAYPIGQPLDPKNVAVMSGDLWGTDVLLNGGSGSGNGSAGGSSLPYNEPFNQPEGSPWPNWISPGPDWADSNPIDVHQGRGRVQFADRNVGSNYFNARLYTDDAPVYDLRFDFDFSEMVAALTNDIFDPNLYCFVRMMDFGEQVAYYQIYYDLFDGLQVSITKSSMQGSFDWQDIFNYEIVAGIDMSRPVSVHIQESGTDHRLKVWQAGATEPPEWTQTVTGAAHTGPRYIDLNMNARYVGTPSIYFDNISVNGGNNVLSDAGSGIMMELPFYDPFHFPDGNRWADCWVIPGPQGLQGGSADHFGDRGRIKFTGDFDNGVPQFSAQVTVQDSSMFDLRFTLDIQEIPPALTGSDSQFWFRVMLEDDSDGHDYYEIYLPDPGSPLEVAILKWSHPAWANGQAFPDTVDYVALNTVLPNMEFYVRIQDSGTERRIRVWQGGDEPSTWAIEDTNAPVHSGPRFINFSTFAETPDGANVYVDDVGVNYFDDPTTYLLAGSTAHFNYQYDLSLGSKGESDTTTAMSYAERDLLNHFGWFGSTATWGSKGPQRIDIIFDGPELINKVAGSLAYYISEKFVVHFNWDEPTPNVELDTANEYRAVWVHEIVHHFQNLQGTGHFMDARSMTEAHAAFLERLFRRTIGDWAALKIGGYAQHVQTWLNSNRDDYVNYPVPFDSDDAVFNQGVGCTLLFFNWLHFVHGYSGAQITQAGGNTPRAIYRNLTGNSADPFPVFYNELEREFDPAYQLDLRNYPDIANPYPLTPAKQAAPPPQNTVGNGLIALQQQLVRQQLRQNLRRF